MNTRPSLSLTQSPGFCAALFALSLTSVASTYLFRLIHEYTHHRPLGAATLAVLVVCTFFGLFVICARFGVGFRLARGAFVAAAVISLAMSIIG